MPQSLAKILLHVVFSTKDRRPLLRDRVFRDEMHRYIGGILNGQGCPAIIAGGVEDHRKLTFKDEFRRLLKRYEVTFEEAYVWD